MGKFCTKCGRPLQEGEICSCQHTNPGQFSGNQTNIGQAYQDQMNGEAPYQGQPFGSQANGQAYQEQPYGGQPNSGQPFQEQPYGGQPNSGQPFQGQPYGGQPNSGQPFQGQPYGGQPFQGSQAGAQVTAFLQEFFGTVLNVIKSPVLAGKELIMKADAKAPLLMIFLEGLFDAIFACLFLFSLVMKVTGGFGGSFLRAGVSVPYFSVSLFLIIMAFVRALLLAVALLLGHMAIKIPTSFQQMLSVAGHKSLIMLPWIFVAAILNILSPFIGIAVFFLVSAWGLITMVVTMTSLIPQEKLNKFAVMAFVGIQVSSMISGFISIMVLAMGLLRNLLAFLEHF